MFHKRKATAKKTETATGDDYRHRTTCFLDSPPVTTTMAAVTTTPVTTTTTTTTAPVTTVATTAAPLTTLTGVKLIIDYRERQLMEELVKNGIGFENRNLDIGDLQFHDETGHPILIIERKTVSDYLSSIDSLRLKNQIKRIQTCHKKCAILLEGKIPPSCPEHIYNSLIKRIFIDQIPIIHSDSLTESAIWIKKLLEKLPDIHTPESDMSVQAIDYLETIKTKKSDNIDPSNCYLQQLRQIPGMSLPGAQAIASVYPNFRSLLKAYDSCTTPESMLAKLMIGQRKLGPVLSKRIYLYLGGGGHSLSP